MIKRKKMILKRGRPGHGGSRALIWDKESDEYLTQLWADKVRLKDIAELFGISTCGTDARINCLDLPGRYKSSTPEERIAKKDMTKQQKFDAKLRKAYGNHSYCTAS